MTILCVYGTCEKCRYKVIGEEECMVSYYTPPEVLVEEYYCALCGHCCTCEEAQNE